MTFELCTNPNCRGAGREHGHLPMPDPCPHITRLSYIRAKLHNECNELSALDDHLRDCRKES